MFDVVLLSRLQFAAATIFHFLFVPLTLGLSVLIALMETKYVYTRDPEYKKMAKFWGKIFLLNFAIGVVTGITLEFQFGTNWSQYAKYVGDIFGSLLAIEATLAFFLESTFIAVWAFGWDRLSAKKHAVVIWLIALSSSLSAIWILIANAWMQHPVGFVLRNGRAELSDFWAVISQSTALYYIVHTLSGAYLLSGFFVMAVCAYHLLRKQNVSFFAKSFRFGLVFALIFSTVSIIQGHANGTKVAADQPAKLAAMEALWETTARAPQHMLLIPDEANGRNFVEFGTVPGALSILAYNDSKATVKGLNDFPSTERPPVTLTFIAFRIMVGLGFWFFVLAVLGSIRINKLERSPVYLKVILFTMPLPYIANEAGWLVAEVGRQPWIVYGIMKTTAAVSPISTGQVAASLIGLVVLYTLLGAAAFFLIARTAKQGPSV